MEEKCPLLPDFSLWQQQQAGARHFRCFLARVHSIHVPKQERGSPETRLGGREEPRKKFFLKFSVDVVQGSLNPQGRYGSRPLSMGVGNDDAGAWAEKRPGSMRWGQWGGSQCGSRLLPRSPRAPPSQQDKGRQSRQRGAAGSLTLSVLPAMDPQAHTVGP